MKIVVIDFEDKYAPDFKRLNIEWLDKYELTEPADISMLENYQPEILATGGAIFLAKSGDEIVGSAALIQESPGEFELAKMAVTASFQGKGISKLLIEKCLAAAKQLGAKKVFLVSNRKLATALSLYEKYGFAHVPVTSSHYATADVMMELLM
ncbi:MAG: GNAT family N-acetyltransferase [Chitinophagaceae bacterium]|nr:GNAT family N-acetyltransferase [Chitinophagaceae bacterium]